MKNDITSSEKPIAAPKKPVLDPVGLLNLAIVYVVWSSTYLAIRVAVREGGGFPPFTLGLTRMPRPSDSWIRPSDLMSL